MIVVEENYLLLLIKYRWRLAKGKGGLYPAVGTTALMMMMIIGM